MWLFTKYGFYSVGCARQGDGAYGQPIDKGRLMVRARVRQHLEVMKTRFPALLGDAEIPAFPGSDYAFRIFVPKTAWMTVAVELTDEIAYDNFKGEVANGSTGQDYEDALHDVWSIMNRLQSRT